MKLSDIKPNPSNPRICKDDKFKKLVQSLKDFPEMMSLRPIIIDENNTSQGGNMRYKALSEIKKEGRQACVRYYEQVGKKENIKYFEGLFKTGELPDEWVKQGKDLTEEQWREFVIKDNIGFGEWDLEDLQNDWSDLPLEDWGMDLPDIEEPKKKKIEQLSDFKRSHILISYHPNRHLEIQELLEKLSEYTDIDIETASN